ncbi:cysteine-rich small domain-containing protein [Butyrivibrio sp. MC2013]|uniref:cysteine-rich small domain-containing protein n=1 Tax=Butyrivibrio sp. MC2013 TaxID=1280686 RepID=UPI00041CAB86|nr:cysteine-rich small domain-containing protein [Butyrivibrio sp. MC2013]
MDNSYKYFENHDCKYYPCHKGQEHINCLFCYCPLYSMDNCPGNYTYREKNGRLIKSCIDCSFPHLPENYEKVIKILAAQNSKPAKDK